MSCGTGKCMKPGPLTRNGYLNFLRDYRKKNCGMSAIETVRQGARAWNSLSCEEKQKYRQMAVKIKRSRRDRSRSRRLRSARRGCSPKRQRSRRRSSRRKSSSARRRHSRPKRRSNAKRCMRPGRITNNGYLNFLREFRRKVCGLTPQETIRRGARQWCSLGESEKAKYRRRSSSSKSKRRRSRPQRRTKC